MSLAYQNHSLNYHYKSVDWLLYNTSIVIKKINKKNLWKTPFENFEVILCISLRIKNISIEIFFEGYL